MVKKEEGKELALVQLAAVFLSLAYYDWGRGSLGIRCITNVLCRTYKITQLTLSGVTDYSCIFIMTTIAHSNTTMRAVSMFIELIPLNKLVGKLYMSVPVNTCPASIGFKNCKCIFHHWCRYSLRNSLRMLVTMINPPGRAHQLHFFP